MKKIVVEITEHGSYVPRSGKKDTYNVHAGQEYIDCRCSNQLCNSRKTSIYIKSIIESMIGACETQRKITELCKGRGPSGPKGLGSHSCGHSFHVKIMIEYCVENNKCPDSP